jgi:uncharacterized protein (DUF2384 family)
MGVESLFDADDLERVISAAESVSGDRAKAVEWLSQPLATFDGKTSLQLVAEGRTDAVIGYLHSIASGFVG